MSDKTSPKTKISDEVWNGVISEWVGNNLANSAMSGSTEAWNHLMSQLPKLREMLERRL